MGGGIGIPYSSRQRPIDMGILKSEFAKIVERNKNELNAKLLIESGRYLICQASTYMIDIVDIKISKNKKYLVVRNGLNGFMRPVIKELLKGFLNGDYSAEPLFTDIDAFEYNIQTEEIETEIVDVVGNLCTATDIIAKDIKLPRAKIDDILTISNVGSYVYTLSLVLFSSQEIPNQYLI